jgi:proteasome lid subunit RPN8/RPN11
MLCAAALLLQGAAAGAAREGPCPPVVLGKTHGSLDRAAAATFQKLLIGNERYEHGGFFVEQNGRFRASEPVTQRSGKDVSYCIVLPRGAKLAGLYHTHVASSELSVSDRRNAERMAVPSYIGTIRDGSVLVYDAGARKTRAFWRSIGQDGDAALAALDPRPAQPLAAATSRAVDLLGQAVAMLERWKDAAHRALLANE